MDELSLFSGAGGGLLGSKLLGWRSVGYVENNEYCQKVLRQRIADGILDAAPIFGDIRKFLSEGWADRYRGKVDIVTGGFPCQDISVAGNGAGLEGERSGLWREMAEIIGKVRPAYVFVENSPMLAIRGGARVVGDLTSMGYDARWGIVGADDIRANHRRKRIWILAYPNEQRSQERRIPMLQREGLYDASRRSRSGSATRETVANAAPVHAQRLNDGSRPAQPRRGGWWEIEPDVDRVAYGLASAVDRLIAIGNGQVPLCMAYAFSKLSEGIVES